MSLRLKYCSLSNIAGMVLFLLPLAFPIVSTAQDRMASRNGEWELEVTGQGSIKSLTMRFGNKKCDIPWHYDGKYSGPCFEVPMERRGYMSYGHEDGMIDRSIKYIDNNGTLTMAVALENISGKGIKTDAFSLCLGINHVMHDPKTYYSMLFPTMLRCEKTHFWGYFQSPDGKVLAIASPDSVASWHIDYIGNGHRIATSWIDLLHKGPLPSRHPQSMDTLAPGERKEWRFSLIPLMDISDVPAAVAQKTGVPVISMPQTTVAPMERVSFSVFSNDVAHVDVRIIAPDGKEVSGIVSGMSDKGVYEFKAPPTDGLYKIRAVAGGHVAEAEFYVRKPWSWYLHKACEESMRMDQKAAQHREAWMGFFSEYWALAYSPDSVRLAMTERRFEKFMETVIDPATGFYDSQKPTWHKRPQNTSWMIGVLTARYAATKDIKHLEMAAKWADHLINRFQHDDGAYEGYTALTMGARFLVDLMWQEQEFAKTDPVWKARYDRHLRSAEAAAYNLLAVGDLGETEGEATYEDTQAGSAWSLLAMHSLMHKGDSLSDRFLKESLKIRKRHECLTQALVPDGRMRGGTLRWWEAQYDVLIRRNFMNSPHGWTMRSQFGAMYLYLLTGNERYLDIAFNAMGSCVQSIDNKTGELRWAFVPDPYVAVSRFIQDYRCQGEGKYIEEVIGEQWLPMISGWWRVPDNTVAGYRKEGWSCDNDVHEHFRFLAQDFMPNAFVKELPDGTFRSWNCVVEKDKDGRLTVIPSDSFVSRLHFNLSDRHSVSILFSSGVMDEDIGPGMRWTGPGVDDLRIPSVYLWNEVMK